MFAPGFDRSEFSIRSMRKSGGNMKTRAFVIILAVLGILLGASSASAGDGVSGKAKDAVEGIKENTSNLVDAAKDAVKEEGMSLKDMPLMPHAWAIPAVALLGLALGYVLGKRGKSAAKNGKKKDDKPAGK